MAFGTSPHPPEHALRAGAAHVEGLTAPIQAILLAALTLLAPVYDDVSVLKFIERNWGLKPLSPESRDNLRNLVMSAADPYVLENRPAIDDPMELFQFP